VTGTRAVTFFAPGTGLHGIADSIADNTVTLQLNDEQRGNLRAALNADARWFFPYPSPGLGINLHLCPVIDGI
jgi:hypothetical protein